MDFSLETEIWNLKGSFQKFSRVLFKSQHSTPSTLQSCATSLILLILPSSLSKHTKGKKLLNPSDYSFTFFISGMGPPLSLLGLVEQGCQLLWGHRNSSTNLLRISSCRGTIPEGKCRAPELIALCRDRNPTHTYFLLGLVPCPMDSSSLFHCCPSY